MNNNECLNQLVAYTYGASRSELKDSTFDPRSDREIEQWIKEYSVHVLHCKSPHRHFKLKRLVSAPYIVTAVGNIGLLDMNVLAVVGPRKSSLYAMQVLEDFFEVCAKYSMVTISGGAIGVDMICHKKSMDLGIPTIVVLGEGLRHAMQGPKNLFIKKVVEAGGLVVSEFPLDMVAARWSFPQRNRIVAGMSEVVFVPAAGKKSGSLISVDFAAQMHIPVYTVPGSIYDATSAGTNEYLSKGIIQGIIQFDEMLSKYFSKKSVEGKEQVFEEMLTEGQKTLLDKLPATKSALLSQGVSLADITMVEIGGQVVMNEKGELVVKK